MWLATGNVPGVVSIRVSALNLPLSMPAATVKALITEPGSSTSVTARLRRNAGSPVPPAFGL